MGGVLLPGKVTQRGSCSGEVGVRRTEGSPLLGVQQPPLFQLGLLPLTAVWGQSPSPHGQLPAVPAPVTLATGFSLGSANRKGPLCPGKGEGERRRKLSPGGWALEGGEGLPLPCCPGEN